MKIVAGILGGLFIAVLGAVLITITLASTPRAITWGPISFFVFWAVGIAIALLASSASKAWRRLLITCSILSFLLPLSGLIYTGSYISTHVDQADKYSGAATAGAAIGGGLVSGILGFFGFFLGVVFLVIGLLVGRDKQIVYVQGPPPTATEAASFEDQGRREPRI